AVTQPAVRKALVHFLLNSLHFKGSASQVFRFRLLPIYFGRRWDMRRIFWSDPGESQFKLTFQLNLFAPGCGYEMVSFPGRRSIDGPFSLLNIQNHKGMGLRNLLLSPTNPPLYGEKGTSH